MEGQKIKLVNATQDYYEKIKNLCDESFGTGYINREEFNKWLTHPQLFNIALAEDAFAGYSVMIPAGVEDIMEQMGMERSEVLALTDGGPAIIYKSAAVCSAYRRNGVLTELIKALLNQAKELGYGSVILSAWTYGGKTPAKSSLLSMGFTQLFIRHKLWYHYENYSCVICKGRCICDAAVFYKNLLGENL